MGKKRRVFEHVNRDAFIIYTINSVDHFEMFYCCIVAFDVHFEIVDLLTWHILMK